jgi:hypothetical protein
MGGLIIYAMASSCRLAFPILVTLTAVIHANGSNERADIGTAPLFSPLFQQGQEFELLTVPSPIRKTEPSRPASMRRLSKAWNSLINDLPKARLWFSTDENLALDAILLQIQNGLLSIGMVASHREPGRSDLHAIQQLLPNTFAVRSFLQRKRTEHPLIEDCKHLARDAGLLAEETDLLAPTRPSQSLSVMDH